MRPRRDLGHEDGPDGNEGEDHAGARPRRLGTEAIVVVVRCVMSVMQRLAIESRAQLGDLCFEDPHPLLRSDQITPEW